MIYLTIFCGWVFLMVLGIAVIAVNYTIAEVDKVAAECMENDDA